MGHTIFKYRYVTLFLLVFLINGNFDTYFRSENLIFFSKIYENQSKMLKTRINIRKYTNNNALHVTNKVQKLCPAFVLLDCYIPPFNFTLTTNLYHQKKSFVIEFQSDCFMYFFLKTLQKRLNTKNMDSGVSFDDNNFFHNIVISFYFRSYIKRDFFFVKF